MLVNPQPLNNHQLELMKKVSLTPDNILDHMDDLNEEIQESHKTEPIVNLTPEPQLKVQGAIKIMETDLDKELAAAQAKLAAVQAAKKAEEKVEPKVEESPEEQTRKALRALLDSLDNAPTERDIANMKAQYGSDGVQVLALGERDVYIFTYLRRSQWQKIQQLVQSHSATDQTINPEEMLKEKVVTHCTLWPKEVRTVEFLYGARAGVVDSLYNAIMANSYFLAPQQIAMLTAKL